MGFHTRSTPAVCFFYGFVFMSDFNQRFNDVVKSYGPAALVRDSGISNSQIYRLRSSGDISRENLVTVCQVTGVDMVWLASGVGSMFPAIEDADHVSEPTSAYKSESELSDDERELVRLFRSAGLAAKSRVLNELIK